MKNYVIVLDRSWLFQNICRAILSREMTSECAMYIDDIDIFCSQQTPAALVIGEHSYDKEKWEKMVVRNPEVRRIKKIFITKSEPVPGGFSPLIRPFEPEGLLLKLCDNLRIKNPRYKKEEERAAHISSNRRIFLRNAVSTPVYLDDEFGEHLLKLAMRDLSLGGMFIEGSIPVKTGSMMFLSFKLDKKEVLATGQVVRMENGGIGVRFVGLSNDAKREIEKYCSSVS